MTYNYKCSACNLEFEIEQKISDAALVDCPLCSANKKLTKIISAPTFILKGKGWAKDGY